MIKKRILLLTAILSASCYAFPNDIEDFDRLSSSLSKEKGSAQMKMSNEKLARNVEASQQESGSPFVSHFIHQGNNLFFKPNIVLGSKMGNALVARDEYERNKQEIKAKNKKIKKHESKEKLSTTTTTVAPTTTTTTTPVPTTTTTTTTTPTTTSAPTTTTTTTTSTTVGITEKISRFSSSEIRDKEDNKIPKPPILAPLIMPRLPEPIIIRESEPIIIPQPPAFLNVNLPPADFFPGRVQFIPQPYQPMHFRDPYEIQDPCAPKPELAEYQGIHERLSAEKSIVPPQLMPLQVPVPVMPCSPQIVGARLMPYVRVSKIPITNIDRQSLQIPSWQVSQALAERIALRKEYDTPINIPTNIPSLSAYCAHNIALTRALPNILSNKEKFNDPYLPHWIYP